MADYSDAQSSVIVDLEAGFAAEAAAGQVQSITLSSLPAGTVLSHGTDNGDGSWKI
jgi:hypothetical protein